ncbi:hypothetical protein F5Y11DRAFT_309025 [Daldinia sp. FL1419]|nr:hypothetical protein F5Y11DRAFT_309025 [Daldinia sp. FL1419]
MSYMSGINATTSLMGFSVHQPAIGAPLQFFPAMGSKQLDEMIDAYVPGDASILDKRATVSMEFFEHSMTTGELFKFFMVYPALGSTTGSPSTTMADSGYVSNFTSPVISESQWTQASNASLPSEYRTQKPSPKKAALNNDFSHLPGMKILTKDGKDVTNSASRGCKTKEQRDHAHLMRIIKACDSCRRKKVRCDPSHKRSSGSSAARTSKKTKRTAAAAAPASAPPPQTTLEPSEQPFYMPSFDIAELSTSSFDSAMSESLVDPTMDWDQFVQYDEEPIEAIPYDYDFFFDPAGHLTPASSNSYSPSQPITPAQTAGLENTAVGTTEDAHAALPPYLNPGGEVGNNYADFNLYSPGSSVCLDDDPSLSKEVAALPQLEHSRYLDDRQPVDFRRRNVTDQDQDRDTRPHVSVNAEYQSSPISQEQASLQIGLDTSSYYERILDSSIQSLAVAQGDSGQNAQVPGSRVPAPPGLPHQVTPVRTGEPQPQPWNSPLPTGVGVPVSVPASQLHGSELGSSSLFSGLRRDSQNLAEWHNQQGSVAALTSSSGTWCTTSTNPAAPEAIPEFSSTSQLHRDPSESQHTVTTISDIGKSTSTPSKHHTTDTFTSFSLSRNISTSSSIEGRNAHDAPTRPSPFDSDLVSRNVDAPIVEKSSLSDAIVLSSALPKRSKPVLSSDNIEKNHNVESRRLLPASTYVSQSQSVSDVQIASVAVSSAAAAGLLVFAYASLSALGQRRPSTDNASELGAVGMFAASLFVALAYSVLQQHMTPSVGVLHRPTQLLPFLGFHTIMNVAKSRCSQLAGNIYRIRSDFGSIFTLPPSGTKSSSLRVQRVMSLV